MGYSQLPNLNKGLLLVRVSANRAELGSFFHLWLIMILSVRTAGDEAGGRGEEMQLILAEGEIKTTALLPKI